jgi:hypothetical protein
MLVNRCLRVSVVALAWLSICASELWACPMCKAGIEADDPRPRAYMYSILFMLAAMGSVVCGVIALLCWISRAEKAALDAAGYQHLFENAVTQQAGQFPN